MNPLVIDTNERGRLPDAIERRAKALSFMVQSKIMSQK